MKMFLNPKMWTGVILSSATAITLVACGGDSDSSSSGTSQENLCPKALEGTLIVEDGEISLCKDESWKALTCGTDKEGDTLTLSTHVSGKDSLTLYCGEDTLGLITETKFGDCEVSLDDNFTLICGGDTLVTTKSKNTEIDSTVARPEGLAFLDEYVVWNHGIKSSDRVVGEVSDAYNYNASLRKKVTSTDLFEAISENAGSNFIGIFAGDSSASEGFAKAFTTEIDPSDSLAWWYSINADSTTLFITYLMIHDDNVYIMYDIVSLGNDPNSSPILKSLRLLSFIHSLENSLSSSSEVIESSSSSEQASSSSEVIESSSSSEQASSSSEVIESSSSSEQGSSSSITYGSITDSRDNKTYKTTVIGKLIWMAENLNYAPEGKTARCFEDKPDNCEKFGALYTWAEATDSKNRICPDQYHLPTKADWEYLVDYVGGTRLGAKFLKAEDAWDNSKATNEYGFSAIPAGYALTIKEYDDEGEFTGKSHLEYHYNLIGEDFAGSAFWSSMEVDHIEANAYVFQVTDMDEYGTGLNTNFNKEFAFSIRCVRTTSVY